MAAGSELTRSEARQLALRLLARREHSREELLRKLKAKQCPDSDAHQIVDELITQRLQSDDRFIEAFVAARRARGYGPLRIREELKQKGLADDAIRQGLNVSDSSWLDDLKRVRQKKFGAGIPAGFENLAKQARFLQYRGFSTEQIKTVLDGAEV